MKTTIYGGLSSHPLFCSFSFSSFMEIICKMVTDGLMGREQCSGHDWLCCVLICH